MKPDIEVEKYSGGDQSVFFRVENHIACVMWGKIDTIVKIPHAIFTQQKEC